jgi:hypothetical protein
MIAARILGLCMVTFPALLCNQGSCVAIEAQETEGLRVTGADQESSRNPLEATSGFRVTGAQKADLLRHETGRLSREERRKLHLARVRGFMIDKCFDDIRPSVCF